MRKEITNDIHSNINPRIQPSFSLKNRFRRLIWGITYSLLFRPSPRPTHSWRAFLLRLFGATLGKHCHVYPTVRIWAPWNLHISNYVGIGDYVICYSIAPIYIGDNVTISQGSHLCTGTHDYENPLFQLIANSITIEDEVWVCAEAFVGPGVTIGKGCVIGARSVVTKNMPKWMVCAGNPCRPIKPRVIRSIVTDFTDNENNHSNINL